MLRSRLFRFGRSHLNTKCGFHARNLPGGLNPRGALRAGNLSQEKSSQLSSLLRKEAPKFSPFSNHILRPGPLHLLASNFASNHIDQVEKNYASWRFLRDSTIVVWAPAVRPAEERISRVLLRPGIFLFPLHGEIRAGPPRPGPSFRFHRERRKQAQGTQPIP